jgi:N-acetylneuraminate synthase/N,N'-diacetyllegionaminate synthase
MTHVQFFEAVAKKKLPVIVSTGLSTLEEVRRAITILKKHDSGPISILHCTSEYPASYDELNLRAMVTMKEEFGLPVGYSDHSLGEEASIAAVALGATIIEKHFTIDKSLPGPDHQASLDGVELKKFIESIRITERILGDGIKRPTAGELKNISGVRRGLVAARDLNKGVILTREMLTFKRPNTGIEPFEIGDVIGKRLIKDMQEDEVFRWEFLQ